MRQAGWSLWAARQLVGRANNEKQSWAGKDSA
jgi:hypothetical protein